MKRIIVEKVREESKYFCDKHPDRECYTKIVSTGWYGSQFDCFHLTLNLCDECMEEFYKYVKKTFGVDPVEDVCLFRDCPFCKE